MQGLGRSSLSGLWLSSEPGLVRRLPVGNVTPGWHLRSLGSTGHTVYCWLLGTGGRMSAVVFRGIMSAQCESQLETWHNRIAVCTCTWCMKPSGQPALLSACVSSGVVLFLLGGGQTRFSKSTSVQLCQQV